MNIHKIDQISYNTVATTSGAERSGHIGNYGSRDLLPIILGATGDMYDVCTGADRNYKPLELFIDGTSRELFDQQQKSQYEGLIVPYIPLPSTLNDLKNVIDKDLLEIMQNSESLGNMRYNATRYIGQKLEFKGEFTTFSQELSKDSYKNVYTKVFQSIIDYTKERNPEFIGKIFNRYLIHGKSYPFLKIENNNLLFGEDNNIQKAISTEDIISSFFSLRKGLAGQITGDDVAYNIKHSEGITISNEMNTFLSSILLDTDGRIVEEPVHIGGASMRNYTLNQPEYQDFFKKMREIVSSQTNLTPQPLGIFPAHFYRFFGIDKKHNGYIEDIIQKQHLVKELNQKKSVIYKECSDKQKAAIQASTLQQQSKLITDELKNLFEGLTKTQTAKLLSPNQIMGGDLYDPRMSQFDLYNNYKDDPDELKRQARIMGNLTPLEAEKIANIRRNSYQKK